MVATARAEPRSPPPAEPERRDGGGRAAGAGPQRPHGECGGAGGSLRGRRPGARADGCALPSGISAAGTEGSFLGPSCFPTQKRVLHLPGSRGHGSLVGSELPRTA